MGREEEEHAKRAEELKAKIAARNKEIEERQAAGGAPAMALAAKGAEGKKEVAKPTAALAEHVKADLANRSVAKRKTTQKKTKRKAAEPKLKVAKAPKEPKAAKLEKVAKPRTRAKSNDIPRRTMDRDKSTGLRPIETQIIKICRRLKKPIDIRSLAEKLFGPDEVLAAAGAKDNKRLREVRNAIRVPIQKDLLRQPSSGMVVHKDFVDHNFDPGSLAQKAQSKARKVARKATGKRT